MGQPPLSLSKNLWEVEKTWVWAGELEGAAARLEWDRMPREPCCARLPGHLIPFEAGCRPLEPPLPNLSGFTYTEVF